MGSSGMQLHTQQEKHTGILGRRVIVVLVVVVSTHMRTHYKAPLSPFELPASAK